MMLQNFINGSLWDKASWDAVVYLHHPTNQEPPCLGIVFHHINFGKQIFQEWLDLFGEVDEYDELRVSIIEGEIPGRESGYSVHISSNPAHTVKRAKEQRGIEIDDDLTLNFGRVHRMYPKSDSTFLPQFKKDYEIHNRYFLMPVALGNDAFEPQYEYSIGKREIHFRNVSELTAKDPDNVILQPAPKPPQGGKAH